MTAARRFAAELLYELGLVVGQFRAGYEAGRQAAWAAATNEETH